MSEAFKRAGVLYGKLGLATPAALIEGRYPGIEAAARALSLENASELTKAMFGLSGDVASAAFLEHFGSDPTFNVRPADEEAALLATAVADFAMTENLEIAGQIALMIVTAGMGGMRSPRLASDILAIADAALTKAQEKQANAPSRRQKLATPASLTTAIEGVRGQQAVHTALPQILPAVVTAFEQVEAFIASVSNQAAAVNNGLLAHIAKLEEEMRIHWWVTGGWSAESAAFFRDLDPVKASIRAGWELAGKGTAPLGLHAAPALLGLVLERGRSEMADVTLEAATSGVELAWRKVEFEPFAATGNLPLLPVTATFALSAASGDEADWKPVFKRRTGLDTTSVLKPIDLGVQLYRERLVRKLLKV